MSFGLEGSDAATADGYKGGMAMFTIYGNSQAIATHSLLYRQSVGVGSTVGALPVQGTALGLTKDGTSSGIVCDISSLETFEPYFYIKF